MKKIFTIIFLMLTLGTIAYSQNKDSETIFGIKMGADFETVDSVMKSKGFSLERKTKDDTNGTNYFYTNGNFCNTKPDGILLTISEKNGLTKCIVSWSSCYYLFRQKESGFNDEILKELAKQNKSNDMLKRVCHKNNEAFSTLINSLNKKYNAHISLPDEFAKFYFQVYKGKDMTVEYAFEGGDVTAECIYLLVYTGSQYVRTENLSDDL